MRTIQITAITPSSNPTVPSTIEIGLNFTNLFHGQEWIDSLGNRFPWYTYPTAPAGITLLVATTFTVVGNSGAFNGRYTVYTKASVGDLDSCDLTGGGNTLIRVNEAMPAGSGSALTSGYITNISTYLFTVTGESNLLVLEQSDNTSRPIELIGRLSSGWGEVVFQNLLRQAQSFAGPAAPTAPFLGQLWYDTINQNMMVYQLGSWGVINSAFFGGAPYRFTQVTAQNTWTVSHNLNLAAPFICTCDFFVDTGSGVYKSILPSDITFVDANNLTATFSQAFTGHGIIRS